MQNTQSTASLRLNDSAPVSPNGQTTVTTGKQFVKSSALNLQTATFLNDSRKAQQKRAVEQGHIWSANMENLKGGAVVKQFFKNIALWLFIPTSQKILDNAEDNIIKHYTDELNDPNHTGTQKEQTINEAKHSLEQIKNFLQNNDKKLVENKPLKDMLEATKRQLNFLLTSELPTEKTRTLYDAKNLYQNGAMNKIQLREVVSLTTKTINENLSKNVANETDIQDFQNTLKEIKECIPDEAVQECLDTYISKEFPENLQTTSEKILEQLKNFGDKIQQANQGNQTVDNQDIFTFADTVRQFFKIRKALTSFIAETSNESHRQKAEALLGELKNAENILFDNEEALGNAIDQKIEQAKIDAKNAVLQALKSGKISLSDVPKKYAATNDIKTLPKEIQQLDKIKSEIINPLLELKSVKTSLSEIRDAVEKGTMHYEEGKTSEQDVKFIRSKISQLVNLQGQIRMLQDFSKDQTYKVIAFELENISNELKALENEITGIEKLEKAKEDFENFETTERDKFFQSKTKNISESNSLKQQGEEVMQEAQDWGVDPELAYEASGIENKRDKLKWDLNDEQDTFKKTHNKKKSTWQTTWNAQKRFMEVFGPAFRSNHNMINFLGKNISKQELYFMSPFNAPK